MHFMNMLWNFYSIFCTNVSIHLCISVFVYLCSNIHWCYTICSEAKCTLIQSSVAPSCTLNCNAGKHWSALYDCNVIIATKWARALHHGKLHCNRKQCAVIHRSMVQHSARQHSELWYTAVQCTAMYHCNIIIVGRHGGALQHNVLQHTFAHCVHFDIVHVQSCVL